VNPTDDCQRFEGDLAELALGTLSGFERMNVLAHVQGCAACREEVDRLSAASDAVLTLAPVLEPAPGFETRLFGRMGLAAPRRRRRWRIGVAAVTLTGVLGLALGLGFGLGSPPSVPAPTAVVASLTSGTVVKGAVYLAPGHPGWLFMSVHGVRTAGLVSCRVRIDGRPVTVGSFYLQGGSGSWAYALSVPTDEVQAAWLVDVHGHVLASALLTE
jgi:anti-sigma factor RsiW